MGGTSERSEPDPIPNGDCSRAGTRTAGVESAPQVPVPRLALGEYVWMAAAGENHPRERPAALGTLLPVHRACALPHRPAAIRPGIIRDATSTRSLSIGGFWFGAAAAQAGAATSSKLGALSGGRPSENGSCRGRARPARESPLAQSFARPRWQPGPLAAPGCYAPRCTALASPRKKLPTGGSGSMAGA
jgi:hypothetical protein